MENFDKPLMYNKKQKQTTPLLQMIGAGCLHEYLLHKLLNKASQHNIPQSLIV